MSKVSVAVLVSGGGTNLQALIDAEKNGIIKNGHISVVISSKPGVYALERAEKAGIPHFVAEKKKFGDDTEAFGNEIKKYLDEQKNNKETEDHRSIYYPLIVPGNHDMSMNITEEAVQKYYDYRLLHIRDLLW